ncbi:unnamed protein product [Lathyrus sativus]|nr:unnamed protein product [Lathyrus sativus]
MSSFLIYTHATFLHESGICVKTIYNIGVCVRGIGKDEISNDYYGIITKILEFEWPSQITKKLVLFYCDWCDPSRHRIRIHRQYKIVEVCKGIKYSKFNPFIFPKVTRVYYSPYPGRLRDKVDWLVAIKTKPRGVIDDRHTLEVTFQVQESQVNATIEDDPIDHLQDDEEVSLLMIQENEDKEDSNDDIEDEDED